MPIQKTVLNDTLIYELLKKSYDLRVDNIEKLEIGTANCYKIQSESRTYFLKEYQQGFSESDIRREILLNDFLLSRAYPTAAFISDINGNKQSYINDRYIILQEFIEGKSYIDHNLPDEILFQAAELLGQTHEILCDHKMPVDMDMNWVKKFNAEKLSATYDFIMERAKEISDLEIRERIISDMIFKKDLLYIIKPYGVYFDKVTYKSSHGDYTAMQYLCSENTIKAVIDFASAKSLPAVWEIMRSYMQSASDTKNPNDFELDKFCEYVRGYLKLSALSRDDLKYMPYIYLYQLGRSGYGYKEYMLNTVNKEKLLKFALWRTDVCRMLVDKADKISNTLISLAA